MYRLIALGCLLLTIGCSGSDGTGGLKRQEAAPTVASSEAVSTLSLKLSASTSEQVELALEYSGNGAQSQGPRVGEFYVEHSENLVLSSSDAGDAATAAGKEVAVQPKDSRHTRVVVYSASSTTTIGSGVIAKLRFTRTGGETATAKILTDRPLFAPKEAQTGLQVSEPLSI